jgi:glycosyltransferase involved in cell wall biosynthesis
MREDPPDVVHASGWIAYSNAAALTGTSTPLVLSVRDYGYSCAVRTLMQFDHWPCSGPAPKKCLQCATHRYGAAKAISAVSGVSFGRHLLTRHVRGIHAVSTHIRTIIERDLIDGDTAWQPPVVRIADIPPATEVDPDVAGTDALPKGPFILYVGQLTRHKGLLVLLEAYKQLASPPPLVLIGTEWPDTPQTLPPGVMNIGEAPHELVLAAWRRASFGVAPSIWPDPLPGVVREAMSQGKPVIGSATGGILDMIDDGKTGLLVQPGDVADLAAAMSKLLTDARLRSRMGSAARKATSAITASSVAAEFEQLYQSAIDRPAAYEGQR